MHTQTGCIIDLWPLQMTVMTCASLVHSGVATATDLVYQMSGVCVLTMSCSQVFDITFITLNLTCCCLLQVTMVWEINKLLNRINIPFELVKSCRNSICKYNSFLDTKIYDVLKRVMCYQKITTWWHERYLLIVLYLIRMAVFMVFEWEIFNCHSRN